MSYLDLLRESAQRSGSIACMGMDPEIERIPLRGSPEKVLYRFYTDILERMQKEKVYPASVKPNAAFFEQYGIGGIKALKNIVEDYRCASIPVILDAKRGDIGRTSTAYAKSVFEFLEADATTVAPYMGYDSVGPFIEFCSKGKGVYILTRTSNKGARDLQDFRNADGMTLYQHTANKIVEWHRDGLGSVAGATYPKELSSILKTFNGSGRDIPLLIPGVGSQGASARDTHAILKESSGDIRLHRINSSSAINYAFEKRSSKDYSACAVEALSELIEDTRV